MFSYLILFKPLLFFLCLIFAISFLVQLVYWSIFYSRVHFQKAVKSSHRKFPLSVIICARNEKENLRVNLPLILEQDYPEFEVIVVDDRSSDGTSNLLEELKEKYTHLRTTCIKEEQRNRCSKYRRRDTQTIVR